ncbi:MAG: MutS-related protein [Cyclobacteriaceae bacterium]
MQEPEKVYKENIGRYKVASANFQEKARQISWLRLMVFLISLVGIIYLLQQGFLVIAIGVALVAGTGFIILVRSHQKIQYGKDFHDALSEINHQEIARKSLDLDDFPNGVEFEDISHPYSVDLDLFGQHSLFQLLNRTTTKAGAMMLSQWMLEPPKRKVILERQEAVRELSVNLEWLQDFQARGLLYKQHPEAGGELLKWIHEPLSVQTKPIYGWLKYILPVVTSGLIILYFSAVISYYFPLGFLVINGYVLAKFQVLAKDTYEKTYRNIQTLKAYQSMISKIESSSFEALRLKTLHTHFAQKSYLASKAIQELQDILSRIETRQNAFYWILNPIFLLDIFWLWQAETWRKTYKDQVETWFETISEFEVLSSMAAWCHSQPKYSFPEIADQPFQLQAKVMGHVLLPSEDRICNDFTLEGKGSIVVLTGSNMSGKSTFLRTIGTNAVLALMGSPVCAQKLVISPYQLFTSMRTTDSLEENTSSFYAELKRLKQLIQLVEQPQPVLFLLDEVLKGTNSHDRHQGAAALIKQLSQKNAAGLVSTHDLALGKLSDQMSPVQNFSFNSRMDNGRLVFDYQLKEGLCQSFNASQLMIQMGIDLDDTT